MTKEAKTEYLQAMAKTEKPSWIEYLNKSISDVYKVENEKFITFDKPDIKKDFCFGHGCNGYSTDEEHEAAISQRENAVTNQDYFLNENLQDIDAQIAIVDAYLNAKGNEEEFIKNKYGKNFPHYVYRGGKPYLFYAKYKKDEEVRYTFYTDYELENELHYNKESFIRAMTDAEMQQILTILEAEKEKFTKRLNTYLKKYGLSKIHAWTYLVD